jgi:spore maturation protein SpmA
VLNYIWAFLVVVGILVGLGRTTKDFPTTRVEDQFINGTTVTVTIQLDVRERARGAAEVITKKANELTKAAMNAASFRWKDESGSERTGAVGLAIDFIGLMALWLGFMKIAEASGLITILAAGIRPVFRVVFPTVPIDHPAAGLIMMNYAANMLGLDNAATPLGIKAMKELQTLNGSSDTASNAQCMFLILNVSSLMLLPGGIIGLRAANGSVDPAAFMTPMLIATTIGTLSAFLMAKLAETWSPDTPFVDPATRNETTEEEAK